MISKELIAEMHCIALVASEGPHFDLYFLAVLFDVRRHWGVSQLLGLDLI